MPMNYKEIFFKKLEDFIKKYKIQYFSYAWRALISKTMEEEYKYTKLIEWIDKRIELDKLSIEIINPIDKIIEPFTKGDFKNYIKRCGEIFMLLDFKYTILNKNCTTEMRKNIEYVIKRQFNVSYDDFLKEYN